MAENTEINAKSNADAVFSAIPAVGGGVAEPFDSVIAPALRKRRDQWLLKICSALTDLEKQTDGFQTKALGEDDLFISVMAQATQTALKTHQNEKLDALQNAVINTAAHIPIDENEQLTFIQFIDEFSVWHIKILNYFKNTDKQKPKLIAGSPARMLCAVFEELNGKESFVDSIIRELQDKRLLIRSIANAAAGGFEISTCKVTNLGILFLKYISQS